MSVHGGEVGGGFNTSHSYHHSAHRSFGGENRGGGGTMVHEEVKEQPKLYYTTERTFYAPPPDHESGTAVIVEKEKPAWNFCLCCLVILFIILLLIVIIALIAFFIAGGAGRSPRHSAHAAPGTIFLSNSHGEHYSAYRSPPGHYDLLQPEIVHRDIQQGRQDLCVLEVGTKELYAKEHLPLATYFTPGRILLQRAGSSQVLAHPLQFSEYVRSIGVTNNCHVVIYNHGGSPLATPGHATWAWWIFKTYGIPRVSVMQGGLPLWKQFELGTTASPTPKHRGTMKGGWQPDTSISYEDVHKLVQQGRNSELRSYQLVDTRESEFYVGKKHHPRAKTGGAIPTAATFPSSFVLDSVGKFRDFEEIKQELFQRKITPETLTIVYGDTAIESSLVYFVLYQLGYNVRLYDGGWVEWSNRQAQATAAGA